MSNIINEKLNIQVHTILKDFDELSSSMSHSIMHKEYVRLTGDLRDKIRELEQETGEKISFRA